MAKFEIERKYLVNGEAYKNMAAAHHTIKQGYLSRRPESTVRVRIKDDAAFLTIKGITKGVKREEYEYRIPLEDAERMMEMCEGLVIEKTRWIVDYEGHRWEVDEFHGSLQGLILAEIELTHPDESFPLPPFLGPEVSHDPRYFNSNLSPLLLHTKN